MDKSSQDGNSEKNINQNQSSRTAEQPFTNSHGWKMKRRLLGNQLTTPNFYACTSYPIETNTNNTCAVRETCKCNPAEDTISCWYTYNNIIQIGRLPNVLRRPMSDGIVGTGTKKLPMARSTAFAVELAIHLDPNIVDFDCNVVLTAIIACYNGFKGSAATIWCAKQMYCNQQHKQHAAYDNLSSNVQNKVSKMKHNYSSTLRK